jgi:hypothetical protein
VVGPGAVLDAGAVVERGAQVVHARVAADVVVGQGIQVVRSVALPGRIVRHGGRVVPLEDELLLGGPSRPLERASRLAAAAAVTAMESIRPSARLTARLRQVASGEASWMGVAEGDLIDLSAALLPEDAGAEERRAVAAYYQQKKSPMLDLKLTFELLRARLRSGGRP